MKLSFSATNPCHMYPLAAELARRGALQCYYSGYPGWKLGAGPEVPVRTHAFRTLCVYGALRLFPTWANSRTRELFLWQDRGFDRWVGRQLTPCDFIHAMPGQALATFQRAKQLGIRTVLNHATGPVREWIRILRPEYERVGMNLEACCMYDAEYLRREAEEYALADFHAVASTVGRDQLIRLGIPADRIARVPYGADQNLFHPPVAGPRDSTTFRVLFAGQAGLRKGIRCLLKAFDSVAKGNWELHFYGAVLPEAEHDLKPFCENPRLHFHGPVSQQVLADAFRDGSVLVLPSLEEGFGLIVPQALSTGLPCLVSDRVGAKDLVRHRQNGSIFPVESAEALAAELVWWSQQGRCAPESLSWEEPADLLLHWSETKWQGG